MKSLLVFLNEAEKLKKTSKQANYFGPERGPFRCDNCEYFHMIPGGRVRYDAPETGECEKVEGSIDGAACCNLFSTK